MSISFKNPAAVEAAFYQAFRELDIARMRQVWMVSEAAFCVHPSGQLYQGHEAILAGWRGIFKAADRPQIRHTLIHETTRPGLVMHLVLEEIGTGGGQSQADARVLATNVYQSTPDGWRMLGHHATQSRAEAVSVKVKRRLH